MRAAGALVLGKTVTAEFAGMFPGPELLVVPVALVGVLLALVIR